MVERILDKTYEIITNWWTFYFGVVLVIIWIVYWFGGRRDE